MTYEEMGPEEPRGWSPLAVALIASLVLLLGLGGALFGIYVSDVNAKAAAENPTTQPQILPTVAPVTPTSTSPTPSPTVAPTTPTPPPTSTPPSDSVLLPKLAGLTFQEARTKVRELKLEWVLKFESNSNDATVRASSPSEGALVPKGATVTIFVKGGAPLATVPVIAGKQCAAATLLIIDAGLYPDYKTSARTGVVLPGVVPPGLRWNDKMPLTCTG